MKTTTAPAKVGEKKLTNRDKQRQIDKQLGLKRSDEVFTLPVDAIMMLEEDRDDNPRNIARYGKQAQGEDKLSYEELKASIKAVGQKQAVFVYWNEKLGAYCLAVGWRRTTAMKELKAEGEEVAPIKCVQASSNREDRMFLHFEENMQDALKDEEKAVGIHRLHTVYKVSLMNISKRLGISYQKVAKLASMMDNASSALVDSMREGDVSVSTVQSIVKAAADTVEQNNLFEQGRQAAIEEAKVKEAQRKTKRAAELAKKKEEEAERLKAIGEATPSGETAPTEVKVKGKPGRKAAPKAEEILDVEAGRVYTASDISDAEVGNVKVRPAHIPALVSKLSLETKMTIALKRGYDMGNKVDQVLLARVANIVLFMNDPGFVMTNENVANMFAELSDDETTEMFDK